MAPVVWLELLLLALATQLVATTGCTFEFIDADGDVWPLASLAGIRTGTGSGISPVVTWTYRFNICANLLPVPSPCSTAGVLGTVAARYSFTPAPGSCEQLGPDYNLNAASVVITKTTGAGSAQGVSLKWSSIESGARSFEVRIICSLTNVIGRASLSNNPVSALSTCIFLSLCVSLYLPRSSLSLSLSLSQIYHLYWPTGLLLNTSCS